MITTKELRERHMTNFEKEKKEKYVKGMKKVFSDFEKRYGDDAKSVMYATATKNAMREEEQLFEETIEVDESVVGANKDGKPIVPVVLVLKRKALRLYPDGQLVALYYADKIKRHITVPFSTIGVEGEGSTD